MTTTATWRRMAVTVALAGIALGASACGSSSSSSTTTSTPSSSTSSPSGSSTTTSASGSSTTSTTSASNSAAALAQIEAKIEAGETANYLAAYSITSVSGTTTTVGTFTLAHAGSDDLVGFAGKTSDFEEIVAGTTDVICVKQTSTASWTCYSGAEVASLGASLTALEDVFGSHAALEYLRALAPAGTHLTQSTGSFAGQSVSCWTATTASNSGTYTYCVTSAGVIAEAIGKDSTSSWRMVLTSYSSSVPSSEFTPPATPSTIPTGT